LKTMGEFIVDYRVGKTSAGGHGSGKLPIRPRRL
jgi:hypothetical protein